MTIRLFYTLAGLMIATVIASAETIDDLIRRAEAAQWAAEAADDRDAPPDERDRLWDEAVRLYTEHARRYMTEHGIEMVPTEDAVRELIGPDAVRELMSPEPVTNEPVKSQAMEELERYLAETESAVEEAQARGAPDDEIWRLQQEVTEAMYLVASQRLVDLGLEPESNGPIIVPGQRPRARTFVLPTVTECRTSPVDAEHAVLNYARSRGIDMGGWFSGSGVEARPIPDVECAFVVMLNIPEGRWVATVEPEGFVSTFLPAP